MDLSQRFQIPCMRTQASLQVLSFVQQWPIPIQHLEVLRGGQYKPNAAASGKPKATEENSCLVSSLSETLYLDQPTSSNQVLFKLSRVIKATRYLRPTLYWMIVRSALYSNMKLLIAQAFEGRPKTIHSVVLRSFCIAAWQFLPDPQGSHCKGTRPCPPYIPSNSSAGEVSSLQGPACQ